MVLTVEQNPLRGLVARLTTPLLPDDYLQLFNPLWSARELRGRIVEVRPETADAATLIIKPGRGFDFRFAAGQYIGIGVLVDGRWHWRSYSLTCPPSRLGRDRRAGRLISVTVKAMPEGFLSGHLVNGVPAGTIVRLAAPQGDFVLPEPPPAKLLFLTAGSGITPVMGMLRTLARRGAMPDVVHIHSARQPDDVLFGDELREMAIEHAGFTPHLHFTGVRGKFAPTDLDEICPDWRSRDTWACGPLPMLKDLETHWAAADLDNHLHTERFEVEHAAIGEGGTITFARSGHAVEADGATTVLQAAEQRGIRLPSGCRVGICQTCLVTVTEGHTRDLRTGLEHHAGEMVQSCVSAAAGDCSIDA
ncbi:ferredoxin reductase [Nocardia concava]|uniref:ferredoxin reductase n=1 Tax=Nocardia concava TaxID=257281 RepID=UPI0006865D22|nr:ferredoxin reductase [Nocardia concava]